MIWRRIQNDSVNSQGIDYDHPVVIGDSHYLADNSVAGVYHFMGEVAGHSLLSYCGRCSDPNPNRDDCLASQLGEESFYVE